MAMLAIRNRVRVTRLTGAIMEAADAMGMRAITVNIFKSKEIRDSNSRMVIGDHFGHVQQSTCFGHPFK